MLVNLSEVNKRCAKILLLLLNGLCILVAICAITFSVVDIHSLQQYGADRSIGTCIGDVFIMSACFLLVAIAAFGSVGVIKENIKILYMYIGLLMIMIVLEMMILVYVSVQRYELEFQVSEWLREDFFRNTTDLDHHAHKKVWDTLQTSYECCGVNGPGDYTAVKKQISLSCCSRAYRSSFAQDQLYKLCVQGTGYYFEGCEDKILFMLRSDAGWLIGVAISFWWFEAAEIILAVSVAKSSINKSLKYKKSNRYY